NTVYPWIVDSRIRSTPCCYRRASCITRRTFSTSKPRDRQKICAGSELRSTNYQAKSRITYLCQGPSHPGYKPRAQGTQLQADCPTNPSRSELFSRREESLLTD